MPTIREITVADNAVIAGIIRSVLAEFKANKPGTVYFDPTTDDLYGLFHGVPGAGYYILELDGQVAGGAGIFPTVGLPTGCCELVKLYLMPWARRRGMGRLLINACFDLAQRLGYQHVYLETMPELAMAVSLYEQCGFEYLQAPLGNSGHFGCGIWMLKLLQAATDAPVSLP